VDRPPYSSDLALTDFHLFRSLQKHLADKRFAIDADTEQAVTSRLGKPDVDILFLCGDGGFVVRVGKFLRICGDCVESGVLHLLPMYRVHVEVRFK
jgi:hypothetical protein